MQPVPLKYLRGYPEPLQAQVRQLLADGGVAPVLAATFPLAAAADAHRLMESSRHIGKIVLTLGAAS